MFRPLFITGLLVLGCCFVLYMLYLHFGLSTAKRNFVIVAFAVLIAFNWMSVIFGDGQDEPERTSKAAVTTREPEQTPTPPPQDEEPEPVKQCTPKRGTAKFYGTERVSAEGRVKLRVRGKRIKQVVLFTDGKRRRTDRVRPFVFRLKATSLKTKNGRKYGKHAVRAQVAYIKCTSKNSPRTLRKTVRRVKPPPPPPPEPANQPTSVTYSPPQVQAPARQAPAPAAPAPQPQAPAPAPAPRSTPAPNTGGSSGPQPDPAPPRNPGPQPDPCCGSGGSAAPWDTGD